MRGPQAVCHFDSTARVERHAGAHPLGPGSQPLVRTSRVLRSTQRHCGARPPARNGPAPSALRHRHVQPCPGGKGSRLCCFLRWSPTQSQRNGAARDEVTRWWTCRNGYKYHASDHRTPSPPSPPCTTVFHHRSVKSLNLTHWMWGPSQLSRRLPMVT